MTKSLKLRPLIAALALCAIHPVAHAIKLGEPVVLSRIGEPLHVKIPVIDTMPEELGGLSIHMANTIGYTHAQVAVPAWLSTASVKLEKSDGVAVLEVRASKQHESIVDLVFELRWAAGRMLQTVPVLLDPAVTSSVPNVTPIATSSSSAVHTAMPIDRTPDNLESKKPVLQPSKSPSTMEEKRVTSTPNKASSEETEDGKILVKRGDTLNKLVRPSISTTVTLEQLLVAYTKANPHAFIKGNMNHLKSGVILKQPSKTLVQEVDSSEARKIVIAQSIDFGSYSAKLAEQVGNKEAEAIPGASQKAAGKITAKVNDSSKRTQAQDTLKLSSTSTAAPDKTSDQTTKVESIEDQIAKRKEVEEAQRRITELEQTIAAQKKLLELQNVALAEEQEKAKKALEKEVVKGAKAEMLNNSTENVANSVEKDSSSTDFKISPILGGSLTGLLAVWLWTRRRPKKDASLLEETNMTNIEPTVSFAPVMHAAENTFTLTPNAKERELVTMATAVELLVPLADPAIVNNQVSETYADVHATVSLKNDNSCNSHNINMLGEYTEIELDLAVLAEVPNSDAEAALSTTTLLGQDDQVVSESSMVTTASTQESATLNQIVVSEDSSVTTYDGESSTVNLSKNDNSDLNFLDQAVTMHVSDVATTESTSVIDISEDAADVEPELTFTLPNIVTEDKPLDPSKT